MKTRGDMDIEQQVRQYLMETGRWDGPASDLTNDFGLIEEDIIDSMGIWSLIAFLEDTYDVVVDTGDLLLENLGTISDITRLVQDLMDA